jgi:C4-dicarboxylate-specific signal transduction histidine kinase
MENDTTVILEGLNCIANIIESMREASQRSSEAPEEVNLYATLVNALILSHNRAKQIVKIYCNGREFDLDARRDEEVFTCKVQKQRMEQVWVNIISNALDELVKIEVFEDRQLNVTMEAKEGKVIVLFKDNAGGIDEAMLPYIFDPFVSTKESSGVGIGLNITQRIIKEQEGEIRAYNEEGGAVFEVILPHAKEGS